MENEIIQNNDFVSELVELIRSGLPDEELIAKLEDYHENDIAGALEQLTKEERQRFLLHNPGCLTMVMGDMIFTGDAYIPGIGANTRVPRSNKEQAKQSLERIMELAKGKKVFPGHLV